MDYPTPHPGSVDLKLIIHMDKTWKTDWRTNGILFKETALRYSNIQTKEVNWKVL